MGCQVDVFTNEHGRDDMIKKLGGDRVINWMKNEHAGI